jgi:hypothetical protein
VKIFLLSSTQNIKISTSPSSTHVLTTAPFQPCDEHEHVVPTDFVSLLRLKAGGEGGNSWLSSLQEKAKEISEVYKRDLGMYLAIILEFISAWHAPHDTCM